MKVNTVKRFMALLTAAAVAVGCFSVPGVGVKTAQAASLDDYIIADFDFEDLAASQTITGGGAKATGSYTVVDSYEGGGKAIHFNAGSRQYISLTKEDDSDLFSDIGTGMTISYEARHDRSNTNWIFFASKTAAAPSYPNEKYIGLMQQNGTLNAERFNNNNGRPASANTTAGNEWAHVTVVFNPQDTVIYVNGVEKSRVSSNYAIRDILTDNDSSTQSICRIGMATWEGGEYSTFSLDNFKIYNKALTQEEVAVDYSEYSLVADALALNVPAVTVGDLKLPTTGKSGASTITWKSSNTDVIADDGTVTIPEEDTEVTLTAEIATGDVTITRQFVVKVLKAREAKPVLEYTFDEQYTAGLAKDSVGNNDAILSEGATYVEDNNYGQVLYIDGGTEVGGHNSYLQFPDGFFDGKDSMTISMDVNEVTRIGNYFTFTIGQDNQRYLFLKTMPTYMKLAITTGSYSTEAVAEANFVYPNISRIWVNVKMVITPTSIKLYRDGELIAQNNATATSISDMGTNLKAYLGRSFYSGDKYFRGYFDNVKVYDYAMTDEDAFVLTQQEAAAREMAMSDLNYVADRFEIPNSDDIRSNITLPSEKNGVAITWTSSDEEVISTAVTENEGYYPTPAGVVTRQDKDTDILLTATFSKDGKSVIKSYPVTVKAKPEIEDEEYMGYLFVRFTGTESTSAEEQTYFSISEDGLNWKDLNGGDPVLVSTIGESGLRDHYIGRTPEGDKFYMIATDLSMYHGQGNWPDARRNGGNGIVVWESEDLVNWSEPWIAELAPDNAGCTWAPEFIYDNTTGEYIVFWSATTIELDEYENITQEYENYAIYYAKTRDFRTFTKAQMYQPDPAEISGTREKVIDSTVIEHDGVYYRYTKNEGNGKIQVDCSESMLGTFTDIESTTLTTTLPNRYSGVEGPIIFKMNEKSADGKDQWCLMVDRFVRAQGYYPLITTDLASGEFEMLSDTQFSFPEKYRHGYVLPITATEYHKLQAKWGDAGYFDTYLLEKAVEDAKNLDAALYTEDSYAALAAEIEEAENVIATAKTMAAVNAAIEELQAAVDNLVLAEDVVELPFEDVKEGDWFYEAVYNNYVDQLMTGVNATTFAPFINLTRAQMAQILYNMESKPAVEYTDRFPDVAEGEWFTDAVLWAAKNGVVTGYAHSGEFDPHGNITREQAASMMYRYAGFKGYDVEVIGDLAAFADGESVSDWAKVAMQWAVGNGIITGKENGTKLDPQGQANRAECAVIINNFMERY